MRKLHKGSLQTVGSHDQARYVTNEAVGRRGP